MSRQLTHRIQSVLTEQLQQREVINILKEDQNGNNHAWFTLEKKKQCSKCQMWWNIYEVKAFDFLLLLMYYSSCKILFSKTIQTAFSSDGDSGRSRAWRSGVYNRRSSAQNLKQCNIFFWNKHDMLKIFSQKRHLRWM